MALVAISLSRPSKTDCFGSPLVVRGDWNAIDGEAWDGKYSGEYVIGTDAVHNDHNVLAVTIFLNLKYIKGKMKKKRWDMEGGVGRDLGFEIERAAPGYMDERGRGRSADYAAVGAL